MTDTPTTTRIVEKVVEKIVEKVKVSIYFITRTNKTFSSTRHRVPSVFVVLRTADLLCLRKLEKD